MSSLFFHGLFEFGSTTSIASLFAGNVINLLLYGALTVQLYLYYISFPRDPWLLKTIVYLIYATETVSSIVLTYDLGNSMLIDDGKSTWNISLIVIPLGGSIVAFLTQATYAYCLGVLCQSKYVSWCIVTFIGTNLVAIIVLTLLKSPAFVLAFVWPPGSLGIDATITGIMIWSLTKNKIHSKQLKSKVTHLVYLIIGTGALTTTINLVTLILFTRGSPAAYGPAIVLSKLYANSMMVVLNDRIPTGHGSNDQAVSQNGDWSPRFNSFRNSAWASGHGTGTTNFGRLR